MVDAALRTVVAIHVASGSAAIGASLIATACKALGMPHRVHVVAGRIFVLAMLGIVLTALPLALDGGGMLLLLVAVLSGYLAFAGCREAVRRGRTLSWIDRAAAILMVGAGAMMVGWGVLSIMNGHGGGLVLIMFGAIGLLLAVGDLRRIGQPTDRAKRLVVHMGRMMGAMIAVLTAFLVVNFRFEPAWVVWLVPTVVITPLIFWMSRLIRAGTLR